MRDILYKPPAGLDETEQRCCRLDVHRPAGATGAPVLVWFHGGGLTEGDKANAETTEFVRWLVAGGVIVVAANYRLSPTVGYPAYLRDAAAATTWALTRATELGGDRRRVLVGGHSAGGWLAWLLGLDPTWLTAAGASPADLAGLVPVSGQTVTHHTVRAERGLPRERVVVDEAAPLYHLSALAPPSLACVAAGDMVGRVEENALLVAWLRSLGADARLLTAVDRDHGSILHRASEPGDPVGEAILAFCRTVRLTP